jgi:putative heme-thiolate monooxygenase
MEELLKATESIVPGDESDVPATENATYPISGYSTVRVVFG